MEKIADKTVQEVILKGYQRIEELEEENRKLREMRDRVVRILMDGNRDTFAEEVRDAVFGEARVFVYRIPWDRNARAGRC